MFSWHCIWSSPHVNGAEKAHGTLTSDMHETLGPIKVESIQRVVVSIYQAELTIYKKVKFQTQASERQLHRRSVVVSLPSK